MALISNLAWHRAKAVSNFFTKLDGWPQSMTPCQLAALQSPELAKGWRVDKALLLAINESCSESCSAGHLAHDVVIKTQVSRLSATPWNPFAPHSWLTRDNFTRPKPAREVTSTETEFAITAPDFADWLAAQGETPSEHIQAWFDAVGVAWPPGAPEVAAGDGLAPLTTSQIAGCFAGFHDWDAEQWVSNLQGRARWLRDCRHQAGRQGKPFVESTWWPVQIAQALDAKHPNIRRKLHARFKSQVPLKPWIESLEINLPSDVETLENRL